MMAFNQFNQSRDKWCLSEVVTGRRKCGWHEWVLFILLVVAAPATAQDRQNLTPVADKPAAPDFNLMDINGERHRLSDYKGKIVIVNFWATWCPPCREEMPSMQRAWQPLEQRNVVMLAINVGEDEDTIFEFTSDYPADYPLLMDRDSSVIQRWPVRGLPTTFVVDTAGRLVFQAIGSRDWDDPELMERIAAIR
jgi:peroxiredoxin